jgi:transcriptional regulator with XRE-family HTH domain
VSEITELLDKAKAACSAKSDNQLAIKLKVSRQAVSGWRHGVSAPDTVTCAKIAEITGIPLARVLGIVGEARAISREEKAVWRRLASAAIVVLSLVQMVPVSAAVRPALTDAAYMHYAK